jgi:hypothetical protein
MGNTQEQQQRRRAEEIIAAFDRERAEAHELSRRYIERVRAAREHDRQVTSVPRRAKK